MFGSGNRVSLGGVVIAKDTVLYEVESGDQNYSSKDNMEVLTGEGRVKISGPYPGYIDLSLTGKKKVKVSVQGFGNRFGYYRDTKQRELSGFHSQLINNFDSTVNAFESGAGLSDPESQLSPRARFHGLSKEEIGANITERKAQLKAKETEEKARRASEGGGGLTTLTAIFTGVAQRAFATAQLTLRSYGFRSDSWLLSRNTLSAVTSIRRTGLQRAEAVGGQSGS